MAEDAPDDDEKTEEPTARRLEKAREDGQGSAIAGAWRCSCDDLLHGCTVFNGWLADRQFSKAICIWLYY